MSTTYYHFVSRIALAAIAMLAGCARQAVGPDPLDRPMPTMNLTFPKDVIASSGGIDALLQDPNQVEVFTIEGFVFPSKDRRLSDVTEPVPADLLRCLKKREASLWGNEYFTLLAVARTSGGYAALVEHHFYPKNDDPGVIRRVYYYQKQWLGMGLSERPNNSVLPVRAFHLLKPMPHEWIRRILADAQRTVHTH